MPMKEESPELNIAVLMGGVSSEHEISLATGRQVVGALHGSGYRVKPVVIGKDGGWLVPDGYSGEIPELPEGEGATSGALRAGFAVERLREEDPDAVFIGIHGAFGEDGTAQGLLESAGLVFTGSGILGSALAIDKERSRWIFERHGLRVPLTHALSRRGWDEGAGGVTQEIVRRLPGERWVVKPSDQGSSVGISLVGSEAELRAAVEEAFRWSERVLAEEFVRGDEIACGVLDTPGGGPLEALPPTQIIPREDAFFDYHAKYTPGATDEITPPRLPGAIIAEIQEIAVRAHELLGLEGMSRTDVIVRDEIPHILEVNTIPGMTETSLLPQEAAAAGISFPGLLDRIIRLAIERNQRREATRG
jgi:D-alanine-D-alanine ligase